MNRPCVGWGVPEDNDEIGVESCPNQAAPGTDLCERCLAELQADVDAELGSAA
jgi:hypothetical protein